jgi:hypothetical protein
MPKIQAVILSENGIVPVLSEVCDVRTVWRRCVEVHATAPMCRLPCLAVGLDVA